MDLAIVYMVAGMSSRFGGKIKQFAKVGPQGETLIGHSLNQALLAGFTKIVFIVGEKTEIPFKEMFGDEYNGVPVHYVFQSFDPLKRDRPWGTTDALCTIKGTVDCDFVICNGDDIYGVDAFKLLTDHLRENATSATIGYKVKNALSETGGVNRGKFEVNPDQTVSSIREVFDIQKSNLKEKELTEESLCSMNIWAFKSKVIDLLSDNLNQFKVEHDSERDAECLLPDEIGSLIKAKKMMVSIYPTDDECIGVTSPDDEARVREKISQQ